MNITVGEPFESNLPLSEDSIVFEFTDYGAFFVVAWKNPSPEEIKQMAKGKVKLGIMDFRDIIFLLFKFGSVEWMDATYNVNLSPQYKLKDVEKGKGYLITIVFINSEDRIVKALRAIAMPYEMSLQFKYFVDQQRGKSIKEYKENVKLIYSRYSTKDLVRLANIYSVV